MLNIKNISFSYGNRVLFENVSLEIESNNLVALLGVNGSGKSTFLDLLSSNVHQSSSQIFWDKRPFDDFSSKELARLVGLVLTSFDIDSELTVQTVLESARAPFTGFFGQLKSEDQQVIADVVQDFKLNGLLDQNFANCSDGEKQRILIATAFIKNASLLLLDEPTAFMDINHKAEFYQLLNKKKEGRIIIFSTHDIEMALQVANQFLVVNDQKITLYSREELLKQDILNQVFENGTFNEEGRLIL